MNERESSRRVYTGICESVCVDLSLLKSLFSINLTISTVVGVVFLVANAAVAVLLVIGIVVVVCLF